MIFDSLKNKENYKGDAEIYQALCYLDKIGKWEELLPNTVIQEDCSFANPVSFVSKEEKECAYEAHRKYIDLHYIMEGAERIATADVCGLQVKTPFSQEKDIGFYPEPVLKYVFNEPSGISTICASAVAPPVKLSAST